MDSWLDTWNKTTTTCKPGELWANCFMREANVTTNASVPIRCDLIGTDVCPEPTADVFASISPEMSYGVLAIYGLQQYMTSLYQYIEGDATPFVKNEFLGQSSPRSAKPILIDILNSLGDPIAENLTSLVTSPGAIGQPTFIIPTETQAPQIVGQTVGFLLQWVMKDWAGGNFSALAVDGNLISILSN